MENFDKVNDNENVRERMPPSKKYEMKKLIESKTHKHLIPDEELAKQGRVRVWHNPTGEEGKRTWHLRRKTNMELAEEVKLTLDYIYIIGFDSFGHRIKACKAEVPTRFISDGEERIRTENYAFVKNNDCVIFLKECLEPTKYEIIYNPPVILIYGVRDWFLSRVDELIEEKANYILGKKLSELRKEYTYNPFFEEKKGYPWWYTLDHLDKEYQEKGIFLMENETPPHERPLFKKKKKKIRKSAKTIVEEVQKSMREEQEKKFRDEMLIMMHNDEIQRKYGGYL